MCSLSNKEEVPPFSPLAKLPLHPSVSCSCFTHTPANHRADSHSHSHLLNLLAVRDSPQLL